MFKRVAALLVLASVVPLALACTKEAEIRTAAFSAADFSFTGPASVEEGTTTFTLNNTGAEAHHMQLVKIEGDHTLEELLAAGETVPEWAEESGGPGVAMPGESSNATFELEEGKYALLCFVPNAQGTPHVALGMSRELTVTSSDDEEFADLEEADVEVEMVDFGFEDVPDTLEAGETKFKVTNGGEQIHETVLVQLNEGATPEEFTAAFGPEASGPPPGRFVGGFQGTGPDEEGTFTADLTAGNYVLLCFIGDPASGAPHFALGMVKEVTVEE